jgi:hypothetical protein
MMESMGLRIRGESDDEDEVAAAENTEEHPKRGGFLGWLAALFSKRN